MHEHELQQDASERDGGRVVLTLDTLRAVLGEHQRSSEAAFVEVLRRCDVRGEER